MAVTYTAHETVDIASRHPVTAIKNFTDLTEAEAWTYESKDVDKFVGVGSPRKIYWIKSVTLGVGELVPYADGDQVDDHETRLDAAETSIADHETRLDTAESDIDAAETSIADHETRLDDLESGSANLGVWFADATPLSPHSHDEEMDGAFNGTFIETDNASWLTQSFVEGCLRLTFANDASPPRRAFVTRAIPAGSEWAFAAKCELGAVYANYASVGIYLTGDLQTNPTTAPAVGIELNFQAGSDGHYINGLRWNDWDSINGGLGSAVYNGAVNYTYLRIRVNGTDFFMDCSGNGRLWSQLYTGALPFTPVRYGFGGESQGGNTAYADFDFLRVQEGAGVSALNHMTIGRRI